MSDTFTVEPGEPLEVTVEHCGTPDAEVVVTVGQTPESHAATHAAGGIDPLQITAQQITDFASAVVAAAPPTTNASLLTSGTLPDARLSSNIARTSDVSSAVAAVVNAAPATLDTLNELAAALGNDANFATTVTNALAAKAPLASPTFTGTVSGVTKGMVGLGNVDNTADTSKPVSTAQAAADAAVASAAAADATSKANAAQAAAVQRANHTGTQTIATVDGLQAALDNKAAATHGHDAATTSAAGFLSAADKSKLDGIATGATANATDAQLRDRSTHTGTQAAGTITGLAAIATSGSAGDLASGTVPTARLGSGTANSTTFLRGDGTWAAAGSSSASDLTSGTLADSRLSANARQAIDNLFHPFLLAGM